VEQPRLESPKGFAGRAPTIGEIFEGRFAIERIIGHGGMGYVVQAMHVELEQFVAIKLLSPAHEFDERSSQRLLREARACARIKSQHVVRVLDVAVGRGAPSYIVMEYLEGEDLSQHLKRVGPLTVAKAVEVVAQAGEAIGEAHRLGVVHRDLKPANLFLCAGSSGVDFTIKVLDFGISKVDSDASQSLTQPNSLLGSPGYVAPEQLHACHDVDARADIWSLGVILYEIVTGSRPFAGETLAQICTGILQEQPRPLHELRDDLPPAFEAVVMRCLQKDPAQRYQSVEALVSALAEFHPRAANACLEYLRGLSLSSIVPTRTPVANPTLQPNTQMTHTVTESVGLERGPRVTSAVAPLLRQVALVAAMITLPALAWLHGRANAPARSARPSDTAQHAPPPPSPASPSLVAAQQVGRDVTFTARLAATASSSASPAASAPRVVKSVRRDAAAGATRSTRDVDIPWVDTR